MLQLNATSYVQDDAQQCTLFPSMSFYLMVLLTFDFLENKYRWKDKEEDQGNWDVLFSFRSTSDKLFEGRKCWGL